MAHTSTPWRLHSTSDVTVISKAGGTHVADCLFDPKIRYQEKCANAAFIVKAVNAHDELVAALGEAAKALEPFVKAARHLDGWRENTVVLEMPSPEWPNYYLKTADFQAACEARSRLLAAVEGATS